MTTIAYKDGIVAADGQSTRGGVITSNTCIKVIQTSEYVLGLCGLSLRLGPIKSKLLTHHKSKLELLQSLVGDSSTCLFFDRRSKILYEVDDEGWLELPLNRPYSIGSGQDLAAIAMSMGATAREAVLKASEFDVGTNSNVTEVVL